MKVVGAQELGGFSIRHVAILVALLVAPGLVSAGGERSASKPYVTGEGLAYIALAQLAACEEIAPVGGACFPIAPGESAVDVLMSDESGLPTAANIQFEDAAGATLESVIFCRHAELGVPPGATQMHVILYDPLLGLAACATVAGGVAGDITATFR